MAAAGKKATTLADTDEAKRKATVAVLRRTHELAVRAVVEKAEAKAADAAFWRLIVAGLRQGSWHDTIASTAARRGWAEKKVRPEDVLERRASKLSADQLRGLALELLLGRGGYSTWGDLKFGKLLTEACDHYGMPLKKLHAESASTARRKGGAKTTGKP